MGIDDEDINPEAGEAGDTSGDEFTDQSPPQHGYKSPPQNTQFRKGRSGNPKGRPKGRPNTRALYEGLMRETVQVRQGGKTRRISTSDALAQVLLSGAMKGEKGAVALQMYLEDKAGLLRSTDNRKYGYLVVPIKLPRDEWEKWAARARKRVETNP